MITVGDRFGLIDRMVAGTASAIVGNVAYHGNALRSRSIVLVRYNVNGIGTTIRAARLVGARRPSCVVGSNITNNVNGKLRPNGIMITSHYYCRSM